MPTNPEPIVLPEVTMTDELAKAIQDATSADAVKALLIAEAEKQVAANTQLAVDQAAAEKAAADKIVADQAAADAAVAAQGFKRVVEIGGRSFTFEGETEAEIDRLELNALKVAYAIRPTEEAAIVEPVVDVAAAAKEAELAVLRRTELEQNFRNGTISASEYIQQSGAMTEYLEKEGLSVESLKATVQENQNTQIEKSWVAATDEFLATSDWPGGQKNLELIGLKIAAMGLLDAKDKAAAIAEAYADMKRTGLYFPNGDSDGAVAANATNVEAAVALKAVTDATVKAAAEAEAIRVAATARIASMSSSLFGRSSGVSGAPVTSPTVVATQAVVPKDATPQEIMQAYKDGLVAQGKDPNTEFLETRAARRL